MHTFIPIVASSNLRKSSGNTLHGGSVYARVALAKGGFASKVFYTFKVQAPGEAMRANVFTALQRVLNTLVYGGFQSVTVERAQQPPCDAGVGHINLERRMQAEWAHLAVQLANDEPTMHRRPQLEPLLMTM